MSAVLPLSLKSKVPLIKCTLKILQTENSVRNKISIKIFIKLPPQKKQQLKVGQQKGA